MNTKTLPIPADSRGPCTLLLTASRGDEKVTTRELNVGMECLGESKIYQVHSAAEVAA